MFDLDIRLKRVSEVIGSCNTLADIGSDHGYLPVYMLKNEKIKYAVITDMNKGPLENAKRTAALYGVSGLCVFRLGNGLSCLEGISADVISVCGMGGELIREILFNNEDIAKSAVLILQPMNNPAILRKYLLQNGYEIFSESIVRDGHHFYQIFGAKFANCEFDEKSYSNEDYEFAESLISQKDLTMAEYLAYKADVQSKICENIRNNATDNNEMLKSAEDRLNAIKERIKRYDS